MKAVLAAHAACVGGQLRLGLPLSWEKGTSFSEAA